MISKRLEATYKETVTSHENKMPKCNFSIGWFALLHNLPYILVSPHTGDLNTVWTLNPLAKGLLSFPKWPLIAKQLLCLTIININNALYSKYLTRNGTE